MERSIFILIIVMIGSALGCEPAAAATVNEAGQGVTEWFTTGAGHLFAGNFGDLTLGQMAFTIFGGITVLGSLADY